MKLFLICSKKFYKNIPPIKELLENDGHVLTMPNCYEEPDTEDKYRALGSKEHSIWKAKMIDQSLKVIKDNDAVLVLNFDKGEAKNYIGGATFLEMYDAFKSDKKIFLYNDIPQGILHDEILGFNPVVINTNLSLIKI